MKMAGILITACVVLAAAQAVAAALCIVLVTALIFGLFTAPRETLGFVGLLLAAGMWQAHPLIFLSLVLLLVAARWLLGRQA